MSAAGLEPLPVLLADLANRLDERFPYAPITAASVQLYTEITLWARYGVTDNGERCVSASRTEVEAAIRDVPLLGTRAEYAARLRLAAKDVTL